MSNILIRTGIGYDSHRLVEGEKLILGGVDIPSEKGFLAHSDGDILCHAIIDALLGAAGKGDIGQWFPDTESKWENVYSIDLLKKIIMELGKVISVIINIDAVIILQEPKISKYKEKIKGNLARALSVDVSRISIKGKTNENMGFTGRNEGAAAIVTCLIELISNGQPA